MGKDGILRLIIVPGFEVLLMFIVFSRSWGRSFDIGGSIKAGIE